MFVDVKQTGVKEAQAGIAKAMRRYVDAFDAANFVFAGDVMAELLPGVPEETGELKESRFVTRTAPVSAGFASAHATAAHELGKHRKYLQRPTSQAASSARARIGALTQRFAEAGTTLASAPAKHPTTPTRKTSAPRRRPTLTRRR